MVPDTITRSLSDTEEKTSIDLQMIPVMEEFLSIQGEGFHTGNPASFIRLAGCDVGCVWCDVKGSWDKDAHPAKAVDDIVRKLASHDSEIVIITGGEPAMHDLRYLTSAIKKLGKKIHIETSATQELRGYFDWITVSPKKFKPPLESVLKMADELKVIIYNRSDLAWALSFIPLLKPGCELFLQPEYSRRDLMTSLILDFLESNPDWKISIQTHKTLGVQ
jgi:organic radical activating enzyme